MIATLKLSARNLLRYRRRTLLTAGLITLGVVALLLFVSTASTFRNVMVGSITDSMLGHLQIHRKGYTSAIDNLPLNLNLGAGALTKVDKILKAEPAIAAYSTRVKIGAMFSNFAETTSIRLNGVDPVAEDATVPALRKRILDGGQTGSLVEPGQVLIPQLIAKGMKVKVGDAIVLVVTNASGSVNAKNFTVRGVLDSVTGPGGRDGYINIQDARELLRMDKPEAMEIAIRLKDFDQLETVSARIQDRLNTEVLNKDDKPVTELHLWSDLSPFATIVKMIGLMTTFIRIMLISIVLVSVMNVMLMAVYERIREIGTLAAIGTRPGKIMGLFLGEGLLLGLAGAATGIAISYGLVTLFHAWPINFTYGRNELSLVPELAASEVLIVLGMAMLVSALASLQPAWRAANMDPVTALRHV
jgi:putative ABC transport system permease protein